MNEPNQNPLMVVCKAIAEPAMQEKFKQVLPPGLSVDRFTRVTLAAVQNNPSILDCDRTSLYNACVSAAQRGLLPDGKEGALVKFNTKVGETWVNKAQFMPMPEGIIKEMAKAGFKCYVVSIYENELDTLEIWNDETGQHFRHRPIVFGARGERQGAVAVATDPSGRTWVEAMNMEDIKRVMAASKSKDRKTGEPYGPWKDWPERMEQKSALHRLRKRLPIIGHDDIVEALQQDELQDVGAPEPEQTVSQPQQQSAPPKPAQRRPRGLQAVIDAEPVTVNEEPPPPSDEEFDQRQSDDDGSLF